jgi:hypothetical protein
MFLWIFFVISLFFPENYILTLFIVDISISNFIFFNFCSLSFCRNFICFQFHPSILICYILCFSNMSFLFWLFFRYFVELIFLFNFTLQSKNYFYLNFEPHYFYFFWSFYSINIFFQFHPSIKNKIYFVFQFWSLFF